MKIRKKIFEPIPIENEEGINWSVDEIPENRGSGRHWLSNDYIVASLSKEQIQKQIKYHQGRIRFLEEVLKDGNYGIPLTRSHDLRGEWDSSKRDFKKIVRRTSGTSKSGNKAYKQLTKMILDGKLTPLMIKELIKLCQAGKV